MHNFRWLCVFGKNDWRCIVWLYIALYWIPKCFNFSEYSTICIVLFILLFVIRMDDNDGDFFVGIRLRFYKSTMFCVCDWNQVKMLSEFLLQFSRCLNSNVLFFFFANLKWSKSSWHFIGNVDHFDDNSTAYNICISQFDVVPKYCAVLVCNSRCCNDSTLLCSRVAALFAIEKTWKICIGIIEMVARLGTAKCRSNRIRWYQTTLWFIERVRIV